MSSDNLAHTNVVRIERSAESITRLSGVQWWVIGASMAVLMMSVLRSMPNPAKDSVFLLCMLVISMVTSIASVIFYRLCRSDSLTLSADGAEYRRFGRTHKFTYEDIREVRPLYDPKQSSTRLELTRRRFIDIPASLVPFDDLEPMFRSMVAPAPSAGGEASGVHDRKVSRFTAVVAVSLTAAAVAGIAVFGVRHCVRHPDMIWPMLKLIGALIALVAIGFATSSRGFKVKG